MSTYSSDSGAPDQTQLAAMRSLADSLRTQVEQLANEGPRLAREARQISVTETSADGLVKVTVDPKGNLLNLDLDPRIYRRPDARALADSIVDTARKATRAAEEKVIDLFEPLVGREQIELQVRGSADDIIADVEDRLERRDFL